MSRRAQLQETLWAIDPHTTIKHLVYRFYLGCWMGKILQKFQEASVVDGFAGPGEYLDGADGSPIIVAKCFLDHRFLPKFNRLYVFCQEWRSDRVEHLDGLVSKLPGDPRLTIDVRPPASFPDEREHLGRLAHGPHGRRPTLWILDPYNWEPVPFDVVRGCLHAKKDEVLLTFFVDEVYRFRRSDAHRLAITKYMGSEEWLPLRDLNDEADCKRRLIQLYCTTIESETSSFTGHFSVAVKNQTPRYAVIYATHHPAGMECWTPLTWRLDENGGQLVAMKAAQLDLFTEERAPAEQLVDELRAFAGHELPWANLMMATRQHNFLEKHLREALTILNAEGLAIRVQPLKSTTPWPEGSVVRFYTAADIAES